MFRRCLARDRRSQLGGRLAAAGVALLGIPTAAAAQADSLQVQPGHFDLKLSGFQNLELGGDAGRSGDGASESEIELTPQYRTPGGVTLAGRAVFNLQAQTSFGGSASAWALSEPELSIFAIGPFGRIELGDRAGFPQSLIGFAPSEIAFTAAEFGPDSGLRLDPNGKLPTSFLPPALERRINGLTYLGYAARFYDDRSPKLIYLSPRTRSGFYGALSFTPRTQQNDGGFLLADGAHLPTTQLGAPLNQADFRDVTQAALVWNHRTETLDLSLGATASDAEAITDGHTSSFEATAALRHSDSLSVGATATVADTWVVGVSGTYDRFSQQRQLAEIPDTAHSRYGVVTSLNYVRGRWVAGGYYQHAVGDNILPPIAQDSAITLRQDSADIGEFGASYLLDQNHDLLGPGHYTDVKLYASAYLYRFRGPDELGGEPLQHGAVFLAGVRFSFF